MDPFHMFLNLVVPPSTLLFLLTIYPFLAFFRFVNWIIHFVFRENVRSKIVLITGASSGIGEHLSYEYAKRGAKLVLVARREKLLREVATKCRRIGSPDVRMVVADVAKEEECRKIIDETVNQFGKLDHLVNNAGLGQSYYFEEATDVKSTAPIMNVNFWGYVYMTYFALPHLKRSGGKIIVNSSVNAWMPTPRHSIYNASKAAVFHLFETLRVEVGNEVGITIVTPGFFESEMTAGKVMSEEGSLVKDEDRRDINIGPFPVGYAEECASAMFSGAVRGERYVQVPYWFNVFFLYRMLAPEIIDWSFRLLHVRKLPGCEVPLSKQLVDLPGVKAMMYPSTILGKSE